MEQFSSELKDLDWSEGMFKIEKLNWSENATECVIIVTNTIVISEFTEVFH